jgi:hypothetical protein
MAENLIIRQSLAQTATIELFGEVIDAARGLSGPTLDAAQPTQNAEKAA